MTKDIQVSTNDANLLHKANSKSKLVIIENMNHILKDVTGGRQENLATYNIKTATQQSIDKRNLHLYSEIKMKKETFSLSINPFQKIAGFQALAWGFAGLVISTALSVATGYHYHGLLHYGAASNPAWWCYATEHLIVWLVPALLFYGSALIFSKSRIRMIDVFGTMLFAQIPFVFMTLFAFVPAVQKSINIDPTLPIEQIATQPDFLIGSMILFISMIFLVLTLIWMYQALRTSCNLKGGKLITIYIVGIIISDIICRLIIKQLY